MNKYNMLTADEISRQSWQEYVDQHKHGTVFHTPYMYDVWNSIPNHQSFASFAVDMDNRIRALLVGFYQTVKPGILGCLSKRSVMLQSPVFNDPEALKMLLESYPRQARSKAVYTEIRNHFIDTEYDKVCNALDLNWEGHYNIIKSIPDSCDTLWKETGRKRKDGINKARRFDFSISETTELSAVRDFYLLLKLKYQDLKLPIPQRVFFENCLKFDTLATCKYFELHDGAKVRVSLLAFVYKETLHALFIGIDQDQEFIKKRPVDLFYFEVMIWCVEHSVKYFDWMGAGKPGVAYGVRDFKLQYGGDLVDFGRYTMIHSPFKYSIAKAGLQLLQKMGRV